MNELQSEKLRDIITFIVKLTGEEPMIEWQNDGGKYYQIKVHINIPKEANTK